MNENARDKLFIDTETTGLKARINGVIEVALIRTTPDAKTILDEYEARIVLEPQRYVIEAEALRINQYSEARWKDAQPLAKVLDEVARRMRGKIQLAGHNLQFDLDFIEASFAREARTMPSVYYHKLDTMAFGVPLLDMGLVPNIKLTTLTSFLGIPHEDAHTAMADCRGSLEIYRVMRQRVFEPAFRKEPERPAVAVTG